MSDHLSRKDLRTDQAAIAVENTVHYFAQHRQRAIQIAIAVIVVLALGVGIYYYRESQHAAREQALSVALAIQSAAVGPAQPNGALSFPTEQAKQDATTKALAKVTNDYSGSDEAYVAEYYQAGMDVDANKLDSAKKHYQNVADHASKSYASLGKLALAQIDFAENRIADGEKLLRDLVDNPTDLVSKDQATIALAKGIGPTKPAEAKKLLDPIAAKQSDISSIAIQAISDLQVK